MFVNIGTCDQNCSTNVKFLAHHPQIHNQTGMSDSWSTQYRVGKLIQQYSGGAAQVVEAMALDGEDGGTESIQAGS